MPLDLGTYVNTGCPKITRDFENVKNAHENYRKIFWEQSFQGGGGVILAPP